MRGAGCTYNDIVDRDYDARVARTAARPIPSGQVSVAAGLRLPGRAVPGRPRSCCSSSTGSPSCSAPSSLLLIAVYPFAKRFTFWPQAVLGLTFKWGALVGWAAVTGSLALPALVLYAGSVLWTIGYDTIYAHQDKEDDAAARAQVDRAQVRRGDAALAGRLLCRRRRCCGAWPVSWRARSVVFLLALALVAVQLAWQLATLDIDDRGNCLARFKSNRAVGWLLLARSRGRHGLAAAGLGGR